MIPSHRLVIRIVGVGLVGCFLLVWCSLGGCFTVDPVEPAEVAEVEPDESGGSNGGGPDVAPAARKVDVESKPLSRIPAGTVIGKTAPEGWSHLVMIAVPTLVKEDLRDAGKLAAHYAQLLKFTLLAQSEKSAAGYRLKTVARGFATDIRGKDIIVESRRTFGAKMGMFGDRILMENEKHIDADVRQVAKTDNMLVFDAQAVLRQGTAHVHMVLRHAILIDPATGKLYTFIWLLSKHRNGLGIAEKEMQMIPEAMRELRYLSVKRDKFVLGLPTPEAFALQRTPQGTAIKWTPELEKFAAVKDFTKEQVLGLERVLLATGQAAVKK